MFVGLHGKALRDERQQREDGDEQAKHVLMSLVIPCKDSFFFSISDPLQLARAFLFFSISDQNKNVLVFHHEIVMISCFIQRIISPTNPLRTRLFPRIIVPEPVFHHEMISCFITKS